LTKKHYESFIILDGNYEDNVIEETISKYEVFLKKNEAEIKNIDRIGRRRMAYAIKNKQNGYYVCFEFIAPPQLIAKLERTYRLDENIIRYLSMSMSLKTLKEKEDFLKKKALSIETAVSAEAVANLPVEDVKKEIPVEEIVPLKEKE
jgi:small subunit ribosomal protein S6